MIVCDVVRRLRHYYKSVDRQAVSSNAHHLPASSYEIVNMSDSPTSPTGNKPKSQVYEGGCHCGAVKFTAKISPPVDEGSVTSCNCTFPASACFCSTTNSL